jgi:S1-C subfamily serine protease
MVVRLGRIIQLMPVALQTDCTLSAGDSGGPLFDMRGNVIGIHSRISNSTAENFHVSIRAFRDAWDRLARGESWGDERQQRPWFGVRGVDHPEGCKLETVEEYAPGSGLAVTKFSEIKEGKLTAWLASGKEVDAADEENDLAPGASGRERLEANPVGDGRGFGRPMGRHAWHRRHAAGRGHRQCSAAQHSSPRAYLGVVLDFKSPEAKIAQIMAGLGAEAAGLKPGDRILTVNDSLVKEGQELVKRLGNFREGQSVQLRVQRGEEEFDATIKLMVPKPERGRTRL